MTLISNLPPVEYPAFRPSGPASGDGAPIVALEARVQDEGLLALDYYFGARRAAEYAKHDLSDEVLGDIQVDAYIWLQKNHPDLLNPGTAEDYSVYDREKVTSRLSDLAHHLREEHPDHVTEAEAESTDAFVDAAFDMWENKDQPAEDKKLDGSFAFVVPPRVSRTHPEYDELADLIHVLRYVPTNMHAAMLRGVPPWVVDRYQGTEDGKHGYLVCASVSGDLEQDLGKISASTAVKTARSMVNDAVDLAADGLGVWAIGYGATFPRLMRYGTETRRSDVVTTTGHAGTIVQISEGIAAMYPERDELTRLGVIGLGAIGAPAAEVLAEMYPNAQVNVYDTVTANTRKLTGRNPGRFAEAADTAALINESDVVVSAVTTAVKLRELGITDMKGKLVVDDSQPAQFDADEVESLGGAVLWPIATDETGTVRRMFCGYGDLMANKLTDLFGCEAEVAALVLERMELESRGVDPRLALRMVGRMAITGPVTVEQVENTRQRLQAHGIVASNPQSFGVARQIPPRPSLRSGYQPAAPAPQAPFAA